MVADVGHSPAYLCAGVWLLFVTRSDFQNLGFVTLSRSNLFVSFRGLVLLLTEIDWPQ